MSAADRPGGVVFLRQSTLDRLEADLRQHRPLPSATVGVKPTANGYLLTAKISALIEISKKIKRVGARVCEGWEASSSTSTSTSDSDASESPGESAPSESAPSDSQGSEDSGDTSGGGGDGSDGSDGSGASDSSGSDSGSDSKSAIMTIPAADGTGSECIGWFCRERPEAWFEDVVEVKLSKLPTTDGLGLWAGGHVESEFAASVDPETIRATEVMTDTGEPATATIIPWLGMRPLLVVEVDGEAAKSALVRIEGRRRGSGPRWRRTSATTARANRAFWRAATQLTPEGLRQ